MSLAVSQGWMPCMGVHLAGCSCCVMKFQRASPALANA